MSATTPERNQRILALVSQSRTDLQATHVAGAVGRQLESLFGTVFTAVDSKDWYRTHFPRCGSWDSWVWETVVGRDYMTRQPHFAGFVVCDVPLGRGNVSLVQLALTNKLPVLLWEDEAPFRRVVQVNEVESNMGGGWDVSAAPLGE